MKTDGVHKMINDAKLRAMILRVRHTAVVEPGALVNVNNRGLQGSGPSALTIYRLADGEPGDTWREQTETPCLL